MGWSVHQAFIVEICFSNDYSMITTQRAFRNRNNLVPLAPILDRKSIFEWVNAFTQSSSTARQRNGVRRPVRSRENVERVRASILQSLQRPACKHALAIGISDRSIGRILHSDLHSLPYKLAIAHEFSWIRQHT
ncbi:hypothetical protein Trydic_g20506 [Trypoxylus dichotomus]